MSSTRSTTCKRPSDQAMPSGSVLSSSSSKLDATVTGSGSGSVVSSAGMVRKIVPEIMVPLAVALAVWLAVSQPAAPPQTLR